MDRSVGVLVLCAGLGACGGGSTGGGGPAGSTPAQPDPPVDAEERVTGCDCGSTDATDPCTARALEVTVPALRSGSYFDARFSWQFESAGRSAYCGRFANGDYWIAPRTGAAVTVTAVSGNGVISVDADPVVERMGLLDGSNGYGNYDPAEDIVPALPMSFAATTSLVAAKQRDEASDGGCGTRAIVGECIDAYHVVTVLEQVPPLAGSDMIRPNITGQHKVFLRYADFDWTRLPQNRVLAGTDAEGLERIRARWSHSTEIFGIRTHPGGRYSEGGRAFRAHILHHDYASGMAASFNNDLMTLFSGDNPIADKRAALAAMLSFGLDIYHGRYDPPAGVLRSWSSGAGQANGQFLPPVFLAALLRDSTYADELRRVAANVHAADEQLRGPSELRQIHRGVDGVLIWGDESKFPGRVEGGYWASLLHSQCFDGARGSCNTGFGPRTQRDPYGYIDGPPNLPGWGYMGITAGVQRSMVAAMFVMPEICAIIDHPPLVEYVDRLHNAGGLTQPDPCAPPDPDEDPSACNPYYYPSTSCRYYRVTWGPDPANPGQCIRGSGRFALRHGTPVGLAYTSGQVEANWAALRGSASFCR